MIKFFRKIRRNLLSEGKTGKYFKYAIGEIVLVVIGILIALQINNWNENNKKVNEESILLNTLEQDFVENRIRLNETIKRQEKMINYSNSLITLMISNSSRTISQDSLLKLKAIGANSWWKATLVNSTYETIINSGKSNIIQNLNLKKKLAQYSTDLESGFEDDSESKESLFFMYNISFQYESNFLNEEEQKHYVISIPQDSVRKSIDKLLSNKLYLGALINKTGLESTRLNYQKKLFKQTDEILLEIRSEYK